MSDDLQYGSHQFDSGDAYEGYFKNGQFEGQGKITWANGNTFSGRWSEGMKF
jgi:hypothetical protein